jgi:glutamate synthase domain-containing protein 3
LAACASVALWLPSFHQCQQLNKRARSLPAAGSAKGKAILADWSNAVQKFWQLVPPSEANTPQASQTADQAALEGAPEADGVAAVAATA